MPDCEAYPAPYPCPSWEVFHSSGDSLDHVVAASSQQ